MNAIVPKSPKPKLLVLELWGLGDLAIATPFLRAASKHFDVTLLAKPHAIGLQKELWPGVRVIPFTAPWTAFRGKYKLVSWPWRDLFSLLRELRREHFDIVLSARWDPRDHLLMRFSGAKQRWGFPRVGSGVFLTRRFSAPNQHRHENWRMLADALGFQLPSREKLHWENSDKAQILIHTGAAQPVRVWPLERFQALARNLRQLNYYVRIVCDSNQENWWRERGEAPVVPKNLEELFTQFHQSALFIGNDSGPGHLAAVAGLPTFTIFGPQLPHLFIPLHPRAEWIEGKSCPHKPCSDYCRFDVPHCMQNLTLNEVFKRVEAFTQKQLPAGESLGFKS